MNGPYVSAALELFKLSDIDCSDQIVFFSICEWNATGLYDLSICF